MAPSREEAKAYGRIGGLRLASLHDPRTYTAAGRKAFLAMDHSSCATCGHPPPIPEGLGEAERERRLTARKSEHMSRLALRSAIARRSR